MLNINKVIPEKITQAVGRQALTIQKNSPTILFAAGIVGVVATTVMASRATLKVEPILEKTKTDLDNIKTVSDAGHPDYSDEDKQKDTIYVYAQCSVDLAKLYFPTAVVGILSVAALTKSHTMLKSREAALMAAYTALDGAFRKYRSRVVEALGEDGKLKEAHFLYDLEEREAEVAATGEKVKVFRVNGNTPSGYARYFTKECSSWSPNPEYNLIFLRCQENYANDLLRARGHVFLNEVYDMCGLPRSVAGQVVGWSMLSGGDEFVDFGLFDGDSMHFRDHVNGPDGAILLDFNVDGVMYDKIEGQGRWGWKK